MMEAPIPILTLKLSKNEPGQYLDVLGRFGITNVTGMGLDIDAA